MRVRADGDQVGYARGGGRGHGVARDRRRRAVLEAVSEALGLERLPRWGAEHPRSCCAPSPPDGHAALEVGGRCSRKMRVVSATSHRSMNPACKA